jgi:hypothetical protein
MMEEHSSDPATDNEFDEYMSSREEKRKSLFEELGSAVIQDEPLLTADDEDDPGLQEPEDQITYQEYDTIGKSACELSFQQFYFLTNS